MTNKSSVGILIAVFSLILIFSGGALAQTGKNKKNGCFGTTDSQIARAINNQIRKIKARNPRMNIKIGASVKNKVVILTRRTQTRRIYREITNYVNNISCVRRTRNFLNNQPGCPAGGDCPKGYYPCQSTCTPCGEICVP